jgi:hypothetical protein
MQFSMAAAGSALTPHNHLDHADQRKVIGIGRNPLRKSAISLDVDKREG